MSDEIYIVVPNWDPDPDSNTEGFQHYRDRDPIWIKNYTRLLSHDAYTELSYHQRGILHGIWLEYARSNRQLRGSTLTLTRRLGHRITTRDLEALNQAGFIHFSASAPLAPCYPSRAPARPREADVETEKKKGTRSGTTPADTNGNGPNLPLEQLITQARATGSSTTSIRNAARGLPEASIAKALESLTTRKTPPRNRIGYVIAALRHEREELQHIRAQARQSLGLNTDAEPLPGEPV